MARWVGEFSPQRKNNGPCIRRRHQLGIAAVAANYSHMYADKTSQHVADHIESDVPDCQARRQVRPACTCGTVRSCRGLQSYSGSCVRTEDPSSREATWWRGGCKLSSLKGGCKLPSPPHLPPNSPNLGGRIRHESGSRQACKSGLGNAMTGRRVSAGPLAVPTPSCRLRAGRV